MYRHCTNAFLVGALFVCLWTLSGLSRAQDVPNDDQLRQLLAPIALYPDTLLAQICAASGDPQQIIDADAWLNKNSNLKGQALIDAAQNQGFDPAIVALVTFPTVLDAMAQNVDDYAAIGAAFKANQAAVTAAIQSLRQQAYASGALDSKRISNRFCRTTKRFNCGRGGTAGESADRLRSSICAPNRVRDRSIPKRRVDRIAHQLQCRDCHRCVDQQPTLGLA